LEIHVKTQIITMRHFLVLPAALALTACGGGEQADEAMHEAPETAAMEAPKEAAMEAPMAHDLSSMLDNEGRAEADRARDAGRKPADVIAFLGIESGMNVIDIFAAGGYYTEVLSLAVGPDGHVAAQNPAFILEMREGVNDKAMSDRLAGDRLSNVSRLDKELADIAVTDGPFDAGITALNFHDIYNNAGEEGATAAMSVIFAALRSGGVFVIIDHEGTAVNYNNPLHRVHVADVIRVAEAAGFTIDGSSNVLNSSADDMTQGVFTEGLRGNTNRFVVKLRKP
jgi:predicted methyltransferase